MGLLSRKEETKGGSTKGGTTGATGATKSGTSAPSGGRGGNRIRLGYFDDFTTRTLVQSIDKSVRMATMRRGSVEEVREWAQLGEIDVALLPTWDFLKVGRMNLVTSAAISVFGPSNTYLLCSKVLPSEIQRVLVDHESFGGRSLSEFLLPAQTGSRPQYTRSPEPLKPGYDFASDEHDAFLLVGENALLAPRAKFTWTYDLGGGWSKMTNAPFVMHVWCCHRGVDLRGVEKELLDSCRNSQTHIPEIVQREKERLGVGSGMEMVFQKLYKTDCGPTEIAALRQYAQELAKAQLTRSPQFMVYRPPVGVGGAAGVR